MPLFLVFLASKSFFGQLSVILLVWQIKHYLGYLHFKSVQCLHASAWFLLDCSTGNNLKMLIYISQIEETVGQLSSEWTKSLHSILFIGFWNLLKSSIQDLFSVWESAEKHLSAYPSLKNDSKELKPHTAGALHQVSTCINILY